MFMFTRSRGGCCVATIFSWEVGWGGMGGMGGLITFICTPTHTYTCHAILLYFLLHFYTDVMLRCCTFSCASTHTHTSRYAPVRSLALPHSVMLRYCTFCVFFLIYRAKQPLFLLFTMALLAARCVDPWSVTPKPFKWSAYAPTKAKFPEKTRQFLI